MWKVGSDSHYGGRDVKVEVFVDGLCEPINPGGTACFGIAIFQDGKQIMTSYGVVGSGKDMSNNVAEFAAAVRALELLRGLGLQRTEIVVYSDSQLLVNIMSGRWQARSGLYYSMYERVAALAQEFENVTWTWIPRERNELADSLSRKAYEMWCEAHGQEPVYASYRRPLSTGLAMTAECCLTCRWSQRRGPHIGCFYGGKWQKWIPKRLARSAKCPRYEPRR